MNQQVKTSLGVVIIIIFAATIGVFIWQWQKNNAIPEKTLAPISTKPQDRISFSIEKISCKNGGEEKAIFHVYVDGKTVDNVELATCDVVDGKILKKTDSLAYFTIIPERSEWGIQFAPFGMYQDLYRLDLNSKKIELATNSFGGLINPVYFSNDGTKIAYYSYGYAEDSIALEELASGKIEALKIPPFWEDSEPSPEGDGLQMGDMKFSPDNKKLAIAVDYGPKKEHGEIYVLDLEKNFYKLYAKVDYLVKIDGWKNNEELSWGKLSESLNSEDTSDWQTYKNDEYGFEFKYPKGWKVSKMDFDGDLYESMWAGNTWIALYPTLQDIRNIRSYKSLEDHLLHNAEGGFSEVKAFNLNGYKWWFALESGISGNEETAFIEHDSHVYQVVFNNDVEYNSPDKMPVIEKEFLNNFKFTK